MQNKHKVTLITPLHNRPKTMPLCERWTGRAIEEYGGEVQWLIIDSSDTPNPPTLGQQYVYAPQQPWPGPARSFLRNIIQGLELAKHDYIFFVEDDDWRAPNWITRYMDLFGHNDTDIVGEFHARYYHLPSRCYQVQGNARHASLCQTGIHSRLVEKALHLAQCMHTYVFDMYLWGIVAEAGRKEAYLTSRSVVGLKGVSDGTHIGGGHKDDMYTNPDKDGKVLADWIGAENAAEYLLSFSPQEETTDETERRSIEE